MEDKIEINKNIVFGFCQKKLDDCVYSHIQTWEDKLAINKNIHKLLPKLREKLEEDFHL